jgi:hypothetical protein
VRVFEYSSLVFVSSHALSRFLDEPCSLLFSRLPQETLNEARRVQEESASTGVRNTAVANPRWLPGLERVRFIRRTLKSLHRLNRDEQASLLELIEKHELTAEGKGNVIFTQSQVCICHQRDFEEERLALMRQRKKQERIIELLHVQRQAMLTEAAAAEVEERISNAKAVLAEMDGKLAALDKEVGLRAFCVLCLVSFVLISLLAGARSTSTD